MIAFLARRIAQAVVVLLLLSALIYGFFWLLPGGPKQALLGTGSSAGQLAGLGHSYGLGRPAVLLYLTWLGHVLQGNLGYSSVEGASVGSLLAASLPRTLALTLTATALAAIIAIAVGLYAAIRRESAGDRLIRGLVYVGYGMPAFFLGSILISVFAIRLHWFGAEGPQAPGIVGVLTDWRDLTLPILTLAILTLAVFARYVRSAALENLSSEHVRTALAVGGTDRQVISRHMLRNSLIPVITLAGLSVPRILGGALVVESLFNFQGIGWRLWQAALKHDYPVLLGFILVIGAGAVIGTLLADLGYLLADPRLRHGRQ